MADIMSAFNQAVGLTDDPAQVAQDQGNAQMDAAAKANAQQQKNWEQTRADQKPWMDAGTGAVNQLAAGMQAGGKFSTTPQFKFDPNSVNVLQDPGYKFRMQSGVDAIAASGSAGGNLGSGNMGVALQQYGQNLGSQEYGAAYQRQYTSALDQYNAAMQGQNTEFNRLAGLSGTGQVSAGQLTSAGMNNANQQGNNLINAAQSAGQFNMQGAQNRQNLLTGAGNQMGAIGNQLANYFTKQDAYNTGQFYNNIDQSYMGSGYGADSMNFSGNAVGSGAVDNYGDSIFM